MKVFSSLLQLLTNVPLFLKLANREPIDFKQMSDIAEDRGTIIHSETEIAHVMPHYKSIFKKFDPLQWNMQDMSPSRVWAALETAPEN